MGTHTSPVPRSARENPSSSGCTWRRRVMFSSTTMELSRTTPMATTRPPREKILRENPMSCIRAKLIIKVMGRTNSITRAWRQLPRKR